MFGVELSMFETFYTEPSNDVFTGVEVLSLVEIAGIPTHAVCLRSTLAGEADRKKTAVLALSF